MSAQSFRLAELIAALSLATDLGMGQPLEQALRTSLISIRLGERLGLGADDLRDAYYVSLLRFLGCTGDSMETAHLTGGDDLAFRAAVAPVLGGSPSQFVGRMVRELGRGRPPLRRAAVVARFLGGIPTIEDGIGVHCEVAEILGRRLGFGASVLTALGATFERWDGGGKPRGLKGESIPLLSRVAALARDVDILSRVGTRGDVTTVLRSRSGKAYDPALVSLFERNGRAVLDEVGVESVWETALSAEPGPWPKVPDSRLDEILGVFADFVDLKSPHLAGHSRGVAELAARAGRGGAVERLRRAGLVHDLGRVAVPNGIWDKPGPLSLAEWERVRLHPYYTERIVGHCSCLAELCLLVGSHHERLDGSGYHRGSNAAALSDEARLLAAADAYQAMTQARPYRAALSADQAADELVSAVRAGRLDKVAVDRVLVAAGQRSAPTRRAWPAGLSDREVEVLRLLCQGHTKREIASLLSVASATVDHHVRHIYDKIDVHSRAAATLFAVENQLL